MQFQTAFIAVIFCLCPGFAASISNAATSAPISCPTDPKLANLIAGSDIVVIGRMDVSKQRLLAEAQKPDPEYLDIPTHVDEVLKGGEAGNLTVRLYPREASYRPSNDAVVRLADAAEILFLMQVDEGSSSQYYLHQSPESLKAATQRTVGTVRAETARQNAIIRSWGPDTALPRFSEVRALIASLGRVGGEKQQRVFDRLEALGTEAVPAIIAQMDDRRALRTPAISLVNRFPDAFEGMRYYGPKEVVDGLDAVLNQVTGQSFGSIMNGGSDRERNGAVAGWRVYASGLACRKPA
jgi:hypothetical protein